MTAPDQISDLRGALDEAQAWAKAALEAYNRLNDELVQARHALAECQDLVGYAATVRLDRRDETKQFALQTVDWCEGLLDYARRADAAIYAVIPHAP